MEKRRKWGLAIICILVILFFPIQSTRSFSGNATVITEAGRKPSTSSLALEIKNLRSLVCIYRKSFSFVLDDILVDEFASNYYSESEYGDCLISQMYYEEEEDRMELCSLFYPSDLSYMELTWNENRYILKMKE